MERVVAKPWRRLSALSRPLEPARFWLIGLMFFVAYLAINAVTASHAFRETAITLWSPDNGLSLLLLAESIYYAPIVLSASIFVDIFINKTDYNIYSIITSEFTLTFGYSAVAIILRDVFHYKKWETSYTNTIAILAVIPASSAVMALMYCGSLYLTGSLRSADVYLAVLNFWIGDSVGMIVVLPAAAALYDFFKPEYRSRFADPRHWIIAAVVLTCILAFVFISTTKVGDRYLFNMIFLPMMWVGINYGFSAVAIMLLVTQLTLVTAMTYFRVDDQGFTIYQTLMFIMASTGQLLGAVLSEREQTGRMLRRQQSELSRVSAQATTGAMAAAMAHEISQPLTSLASYVHSARRMIDSGQPTPAVANALGKAETEAKRAREIIGRIRNFVASGQLEREPTDLADVGRKIIKLNREEASTRGVEIVGEFDDASHLVFVDRIAIEQALNNLVTNAIDAASENDGAAGRVLVRVHVSPPLATLQVEDNGSGVDPEIADRLFQAFETTKPKGMGLGLPLTREIALKHAGTLEWRANNPHGAIFIIELPTHGHKTDAA